MARFYVMERLKQIGDFTVVGGGGDYSDFQHTIKNLEELVYVHLTTRYPTSQPYILQ